MGRNTHSSRRSMLGMRSCGGTLFRAADFAIRAALLALAGRFCTVGTLTEAFPCTMILTFGGKLTSKVFVMS